MTPQEIRKIIDEHLAAEARHDAAAAAATYTPNGYCHHVPLGLRIEGRDAVAAGYASSFTAFPRQRDHHNQPTPSVRSLLEQRLQCSQVSLDPFDVSYERLVRHVGTAEQGEDQLIHSPFTFVSDLASPDAHRGKFSGTEVKS